MGYFNIDFNQFKPSSRLKAPEIKPVIEKLKETRQPLMTPPTPQPENLQPLPFQPKEAKGIGRTLFDWLAKPSEWTESLLTGGEGYEKKLEDPKIRKTVSRLSSMTSPLSFQPAEMYKTLTGKKTGLEKSLETEGGRAAAGFTGRMVLDPLNFLPYNLIGKLAGKGISKIDDITKISKTFGKISDIKMIPKVGINLRSRAIEPGLTTLRSIKENLATKFIRGYGLPEQFNVLKTRIPSTIARGAKKIFEKGYEIFGKPTTKFQRLIKGKKLEKFWALSDEAKDAIAMFLEPKSAGLGTDLGVLKKTLQEAGEWGSVSKILKESRKILDSEVIDLVRRGRLTGDVAKDFLTRGGYFPHTDFAPKRIIEYFIKPKVGEKRSYLLKRKGAKGYTFNAPKAIMKRELAQFQDNVLQDFLKAVKEQFGVKLGKGHPVPEGFVDFVSPTKRLEELRGWALPQRIADDINASIQTGGMIGKSIDVFNSLWKPTATAMNPAFHFLNIQGNLYNAWLGKMKDPRRFLQAIAGNFDEGEKAILEGADILSRGQFGGDIVARTFDNPAGIDTIKAFENFRQVGEFFENNARSAFYLDRYQKFILEGIDEVSASRKALQEVNKYLFDYLTGLTPFETNVMRRFFPFYTWARFNIPLQLKSLVFAPGKNALVAKVVKELNKFGDPEAQDSELTVPTPFVNSKGDPIRYRLGLPVQDIFSLNPKRILSMLNPLLKDAPQVAYWALSGGEYEPTDLYFGRKRTSAGLPFGEQAKEVAGSVAKSLLRPVRTVTKFGGDDFGTAIRNLFLGGFYPYSKEGAEFGEIGEKRKRNAAIRDKMRQTRRRTDLTLEQKREEIERLLKMIQ